MKAYCTFLLLVFPQWAIVHCDYVTHFVALDDPPQLAPAPKTLKYVFAISRSGTRAPIFPTYSQHRSNENFDKYWGAPSGELTIYGEKLMTALGKSLHSRYKDFFKSLTTRMVTAADSNRTIKSAQLVEKQLFGTSDITSSDTDYMDKYRLFSKTNSTYCSQFDRDRQVTMNYLRSPYPYNDPYLLQEVTGIKHPLSHLEVMQFFDVLDMQKANFKEISSDMSRFHKTEYYDIDLIYFVKGREEKYYLDYTAGPLFHEMFKAFEHCGDHCRGFHLHVTHSLILQSALLAVKLLTYLPLVGTTLLFELHEGNRVTILLYQPLSWEDPGTLFEANNGNSLVTSMTDLCGMKRDDKVPYPLSCPLDKFRTHIPDWSPEKWAEMCTKEYTQKISGTNYPTK